jgi:hypothetical protein
VIGFNALLREEGVDPSEVKLARHQDTRWEGRPTPYQLWIADDGRLERYQQIQRRPVFLGARLLASFVATPFNETLFVGLYEIRGLSTAPAGLIDPITNQDVGGLNCYDLVQSAISRRATGEAKIKCDPPLRRTATHSLLGLNSTTISDSHPEGKNQAVNCD